MIEILNYQRCTKNKVIGYVDIKIPKFGLIIRRISHLQNEHKKWFNFPSYSVEQPDGKIKFISYVQFDLDLHKGQFFEILAVKVNEFCKKNNIPDPEPLDLNGEMEDFFLPDS